jgi:hypothetical protein
VSPGIQVHHPAFAAAERSMTFTTVTGDRRDPQNLPRQRVPRLVPAPHAAARGEGGHGRVPRRSSSDESNRAGRPHRGRVRSRTSSGGSRRLQAYERS